MYVASRKSLLLKPRCRRKDNNVKDENRRKHFTLQIVISVQRGCHTSKKTKRYFIKQIMSLILAHAWEERDGEFRENHSIYRRQGTLFVKLST